MILKKRRFIEIYMKIISNELNYLDKNQLKSLE
jgi:hypothetical protein